MNQYILSVKFVYLIWSNYISNGVFIKIIKLGNSDFPLIGYSDYIHIFLL